jgi:hypothetical protein
VDLLKECKFTVIEEKVSDFDTFLKPFFKIPKDLKISKAIKIEYFSNGSINIFENYSNIESIIYNILAKNLSNIEDINISELKMCESVGINESKKNDVLSYQIFNKKEQKIL